MGIKTEKTVKAVVAPGKCIKVDGIYAGPGDEVVLDAGDAAWMRKHGYLVNPDAAAVTVAPGPAFEKSDGEPETAE